MGCGARPSSLAAVATKAAKGGDERRRRRRGGGVRWSTRVERFDRAGDLGALERGNGAQSRPPPPQSLVLPTVAPVHTPAPRGAEPGSRESAAARARQTRRRSADRSPRVEGPPSGRGGGRGGPADETDPRTHRSGWEGEGRARTGRGRRAAPKGAAEASGARAKRRLTLRRAAALSPLDASRPRVPGGPRRHPPRCVRPPPRHVRRPRPRPSAWPSRPRPAASLSRIQRRALAPAPRLRSRAAPRPLRLPARGGAPARHSLRVQGCVRASDPRRGAPGRAAERSVPRWTASARRPRRRVPSLAFSGCVACSSPRCACRPRRRACRRAVAGGRDPAAD